MKKTKKAQLSITMKLILAIAAIIIILLVINLLSGKMGDLIPSFW